MKVFVVLLASILAVSAIDRPIDYLPKLDAQKSEMRDYQTLVFEHIRTLRSGGSQVSADFIDNYLGSAGLRVLGIGGSDSSISSELASQPAGACITSLQNNVETILQVAGFAITNCYNITDPALIETVRNLAASLNQLEQNIAAIELIIPDAFLGRNVFTQSAEIINLVAERFAAAKAEYDALLLNLQTGASASLPAFEEQMNASNACFAAIDDSVASGYAFVQSQVVTCTKFGSRGARSLIPFNVLEFFPQLAGKV